MCELLHTSGGRTMWEEGMARTTRFALVFGSDAVTILVARGPKTAASNSSKQRSIPPSLHPAQDPFGDLRFLGAADRSASVPDITRRPADQPQPQSFPRQCIVVLVGAKALVQIPSARALETNVKHV